jgi:hypothetical protein
MKRKTFRPQMDTMEPRIALSSNFFTDFFNSLLGKSNTSTPTVHHAAKPAHVHTTTVQMAMQIRQERLAAWHAAHPHAKP